MSVRISMHRKEQWDAEGIEPVLSMHINTSMRSTRVFSLGRWRISGIYVLEFGGRFVRDAVKAIARGER